MRTLSKILGAEAQNSGSIHWEEAQALLQKWLSFLLAKRSPRLARLLLFVAQAWPALGWMHRGGDVAARGHEGYSGGD